MPNGNYLWRVNDHARTRREIARHSRVDAEAYDEYGKAMVEMGRFVKPILTMTPPDPTSFEPRGLKDLLFLGRRFQSLPEGDKYNQIQLMTMSAVDFLDQWFETDVLKATMSASGIIGTFLGVRSPGTAYVLLHHYMGEIDGAFRSWGLSRGGTGAISDACAGAAREAGVEIRTKTTVSKIIVKEGAAVGVVLENGDDLTAGVVSSSVDPNLTFLKMIGAEHLPDEFTADVRALQVPRLVRQGEPRARRAARLQGAPRSGPASARRHLDLAERRVHGARLRRCQVRAILPAAVHRHGDSEPDRSVGRSAGQARGVVLRPIRALSLEGRHLGRPARGLRRHGRQHAGRIRAEHPRPHPAPPGDHPARPRARVGADRRKHLPGRADARAAVLPASRTRLGAVPHADSQPLYVRLGHASRRRHHGRAGTECGDADS